MTELSIWGTACRHISRLLERGLGKSSGAVRTVSVFAGGNLVAALLRTVSGILAARFVDPSTLGLFQGIGLTKHYSEFLTIGVGPGLNRELAYNLGADKRERVETIGSAALAYFGLSGSACCGVLWIAAVWFAVFENNTEVAAGCATYGIVIFMSFIDVYLFGIFRVSGRFDLIARARIWAGVALLIGIAFVYFFEFYGLCLRVLLSTLILGALLWSARPLRVPPRWSWREVNYLLKVGFPIWGAARLSALWDVANSTLILKALGPEGFGFFAIARLIRDSMKHLPSALQQVLYPEMTVAFAKSGDLKAVYRQFAGAVVTVSGSFIPIAVVAWFVLPYGVDLVLPEYTPGVPAAQWVLLAVVIENFRSPSTVVAAVAKNQTYNVLGIVAGFVTYLVLLGGFWGAGDLELVSFVQALVAGRAVDLVASALLTRRYVMRIHDGVS